MKRLGMTALASALLLFTAACGAPEPTDDGGESDEVLRLALTSQVTTLNPLPAAVGQNHMAHQLIWDGLVGTDGDNQYEPRLAEGWEVSDDGMTWTFTLRDVRWSDGEPFTADDVLYTYELYADPESGSGYVGYLAGATFEAPDDRTFVIQLDAPNSGYLESLVTPTMSIIPEHIYGEIIPAELTDHELFREPPVGIGPYVFEQWVNDDQLELKANPEYVTELGFDRVFLVTLTTDTALAQLETGDVDFAPITASDVERVSQIDGVTVHRTAGVGPQVLASALDTGPLADKLVRKAVMHAIDRQALVDEVLQGEGEVVDTLVLGPEWAVPDDLVHYDYDPAKAMALLAEAGWDPATEVRLEVWPGNRERETVATIVAAQLQEVGVDARVEQIELAELVERIGNRDFDLVNSASGNYSRDPSAMNLRLMCDQAPPNGINTQAYCNPDLDELLLRGVATTDQDERAEIYHEAQYIVNDELPMIILYVANTLAATGEGLQGYEVNKEGYALFGNAAEWTPGQ